MDQGRHRGGAFHGVGQPDVQRKLGRLADSPHEYQHSSHREQAHLTGEHVAPLNVHQFVQPLECETASDRPQQHDADEHADVTYPVGEEGLFGGVGGAVLLEPVADQQVGTQPHQLPKHVHHQQAVRQDDAVHGKGENSQVAEEAGVAHVAAHVLHRIQVDQAGDQRYYHQHHHGDVIELEA